MPGGGKGRKRFPRLIYELLSLSLSHERSRCRQGEAVRLVFTFRKRLVTTKRGEEEEEEEEAGGGGTCTHDAREVSY